MLRPPRDREGSESDRREHRHLRHHRVAAQERPEQQRPRRRWSASQLSGVARRDGRARSASGAEGIVAEGVARRHVDRRRLPSQRRVPPELRLRVRLMMESSKEMTPTSTADRPLRHLRLVLFELGPLSNVNETYFHDSAADLERFRRTSRLRRVLEATGVRALAGSRHRAELNVAGWWDQEDFYGPLKTYEPLEKHDRRTKTSSSSGRGITAAGRAVPGDTLGDIDFGSDNRHVLPPKMRCAVFRVLPEGQGRAAADEALTFRDRRQRLDTLRRLAAAKARRPQRSVLPGGGKLSFVAPPATRAAAFDQYLSDPAKPGPVSAAPITLGRGWSIVAWSRTSASRTGVRTCSSMSPSR